MIDQRRDDKAARTMPPAASWQMAQWRESGSPTDTTTNCIFLTDDVSDSKMPRSREARTVPGPVWQRVARPKPLPSRLLLPPPYSPPSKPVFTPTFYQATLSPNHPRSVVAETQSPFWRRLSGADLNSVIDVAACVPRKLLRTTRRGRASVCEDKGLPADCRRDLHCGCHWLRFNRAGDGRGKHARGSC